MPQYRPVSQANRLFAASPWCAVRIDRHSGTAQCGTGKSFYLGLPTCGCQRVKRSGTDDLAIIPIRHHDTAAIGTIVFAIEHIAIELRRQAPIKAVAKIEVVGPLAVTEQIAALDFHLDNNNPALWIEAHQVGAPPVAQRHFGHQPDIVSGEQALDAAADAGGINRGFEYRGITHPGWMEQNGNAVKPQDDYSDGASARTAARAV